MRIVPVIDLKNGQVVRAFRGDRKNYQPIETPLAPGTSEPLDVAAGLLNYCPAFDSLYVADLDGIEGRGRNLEVVKALSEAYPRIEILFDNGTANAKAAEELAGLERVIPVIGSETLASIQDLEEIKSARGNRFALSLDWRGDAPLGPKQVYETPEVWPASVIVMTLDRIGAKAGPDFERVGEVKRLAGDREVFCAGGVRGLEDLQKANQLGCGALIATALHNGTITSADLTALIKG